MQKGQQRERKQVPSRSLYNADASNSRYFTESWAILIATWKYNANNLPMKWQSAHLQLALCLNIQMYLFLKEGEPVVGGAE